MRPRRVGTNYSGVPTPQSVAIRSTAVRVLAIVHQHDAGPGVFAEAIRGAGGELDEWTPAEQPQPAADPFGYDAVLVLGGAMNVDEGDRHGWIAEEEALLRELFEREVPLLGLGRKSTSSRCRLASSADVGWTKRSPRYTRIS